MSSIEELDLFMSLKKNISISVYKTEDWDGKKIVIELTFGKNLISKDHVIID